jgi:hypothetical protein
MTEDERLAKENLVRSFLGKPPKLDPERERRYSMFMSDMDMVKDIVEATMQQLDTMLKSGEDVPLLVTWANTLAEEVMHDQALIALHSMATDRSIEETDKLVLGAAAKIIFECLVMGINIGTVYPLDRFQKDRHDQV